jgi:hypothetical protein
MSAGSSVSHSSAAGYAPVGIPPCPYIVASSTEPGAFEIDSLVTWLLDCRFLLVTSAEIFGSISLSSRRSALFGNTRQEQYKYEPLLRFGTVYVDAHEIFGSHAVENTPIISFGNWTQLPSSKVIQAPLYLTERPASAPRRQLVEPQTTTPMLPPELAVGFDSLLNEIHESKIWSWRDMSAFLGPSHTELQRIAKGKAVPPDVGQRIDDFHRFFQVVQRATGGNRLALQRALVTPRDRDGYTADRHLREGNFRLAYQAVMDVISPRPRVATVERRPLKWYSAPSRALHDTDESGPDE